MFYTWIKECSKEEGKNSVLIFVGKKKKKRNPTNKSNEMFFKLIMR